MALKSRQELYDLIQAEMQARQPTLTDFNEGSNNDIIAGVIATATHEAMALIVEQFNKTFFDMAAGPEVTGGSDDLETLAVDHYGSAFERPDASYAVGIVKFSRSVASAGDVEIPSGTIVKTATDANGQSQRFTTQSTVTLTGLTTEASVKAVEPGTSGNVGLGKVTVIESTLTDPIITVTNEEAFSGGAAEQDDATYRETIKNLITKIRGSVKVALEAAAKTVSGIESATAIEKELNVIEYDATTGAIKVGAEYFKIPFVKLYVADANGVANDALISLVVEEVEKVRSFGVEIEVLSASAFAVNWVASVSLNPSGPNYSTLSVSLDAVKDTMTQYLNNLEIGESFVKADASQAILDVWGPDGTNDILSFTTTVPAADVVPTENQKLIAGTMTL